MQTAPRFFTEDGGLVCCGLCPRRCSIPGGGFGICGVRGCADTASGGAVIPFYGFISALSLDPVEKKPLYHFRPGTKILSIGFTGCNLRCPFCQNWRISQQTGIAGRRMTPGEIVSAALREQSPSIAYTYSEPLIHAEFLLDCMAQARRRGLANVLVTNGCVNTAAAQELFALTDAANIDLKSFSSGTYANVLGGNLAAVLDCIRLAVAMGVHVEITTLVVPGLNDSAEETERCADFIAALPGNIPWHVSAYHPDYRWNAPATDPEMLLNLAERAREKLRYVYTGNIANSGRFSDTRCLHCGAVLVRRSGYRVDTAGLAPPLDKTKHCRCAACGGETDITA